MNTDSLYLALAEKELEDCIRPEMKAEREQLRTKGCNDCFTADAVGCFFSLECAVTSTKKYDKRETGIFKEELSCSESLYFVVKLTAATTLLLTS